MEAVIGQEGMPEINYDPRQARATSSLQGRRVCRDWQREHLPQNRDEHRRFMLSQSARQSSAFDGVVFLRRQRLKVGNYMAKRARLT